jgi:hypothetical protein
MFITKQFSAKLEGRAEAINNSNRIEIIHAMEQINKDAITNCL